MKNKEYIANVSGAWRLVESHEIASRRVEVPEGAEEYRTNYKFYKNNGELFYSSYDEWVESGLAECITLWKRGATEHKNKTQDKLGSNKVEVIKEFLNPEQGYALVECFVGETSIPESWLEVPEGAEILYFDKRYEPSNHFFKTVDGKSYYKYLNKDSEWREYSDLSLEDFKESIDNFRIMWKRNLTTPDTSIQDKLKFIEKWLNGEKIQYILGVESDKTQWHNFTEGAMQYIKRPDIKFREAPKYVTINGIEFKSVKSLLKHVKNNFDLEDGGLE